MRLPHLLDGLVTPATTALLTAALALLAKLLVDMLARQHERRSMAAALAGELGAYLSFLRQPGAMEGYRSLASSDVQRSVRKERFRAIPTLPDGHPVFDALAGKLGLLPVEIVEEVSMLYNIVTNVRLLIASMATQGFVDAADEVHIARLNIITHATAAGISQGEDVISRLRRLSGQ